MGLLKLQLCREFELTKFYDSASVRRFMSSTMTMQVQMICFSSCSLIISIALVVWHIVWQSGSHQVHAEID